MRIDVLIDCRKQESIEVVHSLSHVPSRFVVPDISLCCRFEEDSGDDARACKHI